MAVQAAVPLGVTAWAYLSHLPAVLKWPLILALLSFLLWWWRRYQKRRLDKLHIQNPDDLRITEEDFRGRVDESKELVKLLEDYPIVFLTGESGCGKSTLVDWKIIPALAEGFAVAKIDSYGSDWVMGPLRRLIQRLDPSLDTVGDTAVLLSRLEAHLASPGRTSLLIFDQFDYYLATWQQNLTSGGAVIDSAALAAANDFWRCVLSHAERGRLKCLFVIESSQHVFAIPFGPRAKDYPLPRLLATYSSGIISDVLGRAGVPRDDVTDLVHRISADLDPQSLLPVQLDFTLRSLQHLRPLTVRNYNRVGGLTGLIALSVRTEIQQGANSASIPYLAVLDTLCQLLDESTEKPRIVKASELKIPTGSEIQPYLALLNHLSDRRITKLQGDEGGEPSWTLYHEFLVRVLLSLRSEALGQERALQQSYAQFTRERLPHRKLHHLLSPLAALKLLARRTAYGRSRLAFLLLSLCLWPLLVVGSMAIGFELFLVRRAATLASQTVSSFDTNSALTGEEVKALWILHQESSLVKVQTLRTFLSNETNAQRLVSHAGVVMQSILSLDPDRTERQISDLWQELCWDQLQNLGNSQLGGCALIENEVAHPTAATWQRYLRSGVPNDLLVSLFLAMSPPERQQAMTLLRQGLQAKDLYLFNNADLISNLLAATPLPGRTSYGEELLATTKIGDSPIHLLSLRSALPDDVARDLQPSLRAKALQLLGTDPARAEPAQPLQWAKNIAQFEAAGWDIDGSIASKAQRILADELRMHLTDDEALNLIEDLAPWSANLTPDDAAAAKRIFFKILESNCSGSRWPLQAAWIAEALTPSESVLVFEWLERRPLRSFSAFNSEPQETGLMDATMRTLERLALNVASDERARMLQSLWPRIRVADELQPAAPLILIGFVLNGAERSPARSPVDFVREIGRLRFRSKDALYQDRDVAILARLLWPRLDVLSRRELSAILVQMFRENIMKRNWDSATAARILDDLAISLNGPESLEILESLLHQGLLPCDALGPLVGPETARLFIEEAFRYPICPLGMSRAVMARFEARSIFRIAEVGWSSHDMAFLSRHKLTDWMDSKGYKADRRLRFGGVH